MHTEHEAAAELARFGQTRLQVISALRYLYGKNGAETISGLCGTRVVLAAPDRDTAQWSADSLGRGEVEELSQGLSYGASAYRDGVSLMQRRELRPLALPSEIMRLENLHGYLKFPGPYPVAAIELDYVALPTAAARFVAREAAHRTTGEAPPGPREAGLDKIPANGNEHDTDIPAPAVHAGSERGADSPPPITTETAAEKPDAVAAERPRKSRRSQRNAKRGRAAGKPVRAAKGKAARRQSGPGQDFY